MRLRIPTSALIALLLTNHADASPLDDPYIGGVGLSGPTTGDIAAVYWNPAALGLVTETQTTLAVSGQLTNLRYDPVAQPQAHSAVLSHPIAWPPGPGGFLGIGSRIAQRFTIAFAAYTPFAQKLDYQTAADAPSTRYHVIGMDLRHVALTPALSVKLGRGLHMGIAPGFLFSVGRLAFDEDTALPQGGEIDCGGSPCGVGNPAAAARFDLDSGLDPFSSALNFTFGGGILLDRPSYRLGLAYASAPLGTDGGGITTSLRHAQVTRPSRQGGGSVCVQDPASPCVLGDLRYDLPDMITMGATWKGLAAWEFSTVGRWLNFSRHDRMNLRLVGPVQGGLRPEIPEQIVLHRGFRDVLDLRIRVTRRIGTRTVIGGALRFETSAVPASSASPAAPDGFKIAPALMAQIFLGRGITFGVGYAFTYVLPVDPAGTAFDPDAERICQDARGDLSAPACAKRRAGLARGSALGRISQHGHTFSLILTARL